MNHYPMHPGDYLRDTAHLSIIEDAVYRRILDWLYINERPLPTDSAKVARLMRVIEHQDAVDAVLNEFLELTADGWVQRRAEREIAEYKARADSARENGRRGGRPKTEAKPKITDPVNSGLPEKTELKTNQNQNQNQNQEPNINPLPLTAPAPPALVDEQKLEVGSWFGRRPSTQWSTKELKAWNALELETITEGIELLKPAYLAKTGEAVKYRRRDLQTLLNNWTGEIDRWRNWQAPAASDVTNRQQDELPAFLDDDNAIFHPQAA